MLSLNFQLVGDEGNMELQQVIEEQILAGHGAGLTTQEFENRFFVQN